MTIMIPTRVPTSTVNSECVPTREDDMEEYIVVCSLRRDVLEIMRFDVRRASEYIACALPKRCTSLLSSYLPV